MRKASKKNIAKALATIDAWANENRARIDAIEPVGRKMVLKEIDYLRGTVSGGYLGSCAHAHARSIARMVDDFESGYYVKALENGSILCR